MTILIHKAWNPSALLITQDEISAALDYADHMGWYFCPSPINAAFVTMIAIQNLYDEN
jgi:TRAP-type C4-dicarboxylate transport system permease small subunit